MQNNAFQKSKNAEEVRVQRNSHKIIGFKWNAGWSIGTITSRSRRKGFNFMVRYEGEEVEHLHLLHEGNYAFGDDASEESWVSLSNGE